MFLLSLLFALMFLLLLTLVSLSLPHTIVIESLVFDPLEYVFVISLFVLSGTSMVHVIILFLNIIIKLLVTKLLLFSNTKF
jgi:hypothetical protein